ncbi:CDP-diacylglycerol--glycerol-3-phosphate 3-phosphatidyltransferase [Patescibacteria group bacterium]|nr:CDP-diacylglycerol--glycerol-3-phosphate 3-phosphatidyltransferase [Patescibacteria group bacterium]
MNLPNKLTLTRLLITIPAITVLFMPIPNNKLIGIGFFAIASITDLLDGYIARKHNCATKLGAFFDPLTDKILNNSLLITLLYLDVFPLWIVLAIFIRELFFDAFYKLAVLNNVFIKANYPGKIKSLFLVFGILIGELYLAMNDGLNVFNLEAIYVQNVAYIALIISFIVGFVGTNMILQNVWEDIVGKYEI